MTVRNRKNPCGFVLDLIVMSSSHSVILIVALIVTSPSHSVCMTPLSGNIDPRWHAITSRFGQRGSYFSFIHLHFACIFQSFLLVSPLPFLTYHVSLHSLKSRGWSDLGMRWVTASKS